MEAIYGVKVEKKIVSQVMLMQPGNNGMSY